MSLEDAGTSWSEVASLQRKRAKFVGHVGAQAETCACVAVSMLKTGTRPEIVGGERAMLN